MLPRRTLFPFATSLPANGGYGKPLLSSPPIEANHVCTDHDADEAASQKKRCAQCGCVCGSTIFMMFDRPFCSQKHRLDGYTMSCRKIDSKENIRGGGPPLTRHPSMSCLPA